MDSFTPTVQHARGYYNYAKYSAICDYNMKFPILSSLERILIFVAEKKIGKSVHWIN